MTFRVSVLSKNKLKVKAIDSRMYPDLILLESGQRGFVGRKFDPTLGTEYVEDGVKKFSGGWPAVDGCVEVPDCHEYRQAIKDGDLELFVEEPLKKSKASSDS